MCARNTPQPLELYHGDTTYDVNMFYVSPSKGDPPTLVRGHVSSELHIEYTRDVYYVRHAIRMVYYVRSLRRPMHGKEFTWQFLERG